MPIVAIKVLAPTGTMIGLRGRTIPKIPKMSKVRSNSESSELEVRAPIVVRTYVVYTIKSAIPAIPHFQGWR